MVALGFGEVMGGFFHGILIDYIGSKRTVFVNIFILITVFISTEFTLYTLEYNWLTFVACFLWGYQDAMTNIFV